MANRSKQEQLVERLHANGIRKRVAAAIAGTRGGGRKKAEGVARDVLKQLETASDTIRKEVLRDSTKRSEAAKKAAKTRKRNEAKRSTAAKKGAATRAKSNGTSTAKRATTKAKAAAKK